MLKHRDKNNVISNVILIASFCLNLVAFVVLISDDHRCSAVGGRLLFVLGLRSICGGIWKRWSLLRSGSLRYVRRADLRNSDGRGGVLT